ncbi:MAG: lipid A-modifier LpxR family protein, partial [Bacteroidota bacterium]
TWGGAYVSFDIANDVFYLPIKTDQYFTSGMSLEIGRRALARSPFRVTSRAQSARYWRLTQDIFTPQEIEASQLLVDDRPFASYLTATRGKLYADQMLGLSLTSECTFGVLGKYSGGGRMQNALHQIVNFAEPIPGWVNEVKSDVILNYRLLLQQQIGQERFGAITSIDLRLGTLFTDAAPELKVYCQPIGEGQFRNVRFILSGSARLVAHNATLTGGLFNRDMRFRGVIIPRGLVGQAGFDGVINFDAWQLRGGIRHLSSEFKGGWAHAWAWFGVRVQPGWQTLIAASRPNNRP